MDQAEKTMRVLRHGSEVEIPESEFNAATDTRLDGKPATGDSSQGSSGSSGQSSSGGEPRKK